jgi:hypothetical protein
MVEQEIPATVERKMACMAIATIFVGAVVTRLAGWSALGWVLVAFGAATLGFAYLFAAAPYLDDPEAPFGSSEDGLLKQQPPL